jgi:hypothetical protein
VAKAAIETGVAKLPVTDWDAYSKSLDQRTSEHIRRIGEMNTMQTEDGTEA